MTEAEMNKLRKYNRIETLLHLVLMANDFEERAKERTGDSPTVFFSYSAHVNMIEIRIHYNGWDHYADPDEKYYFNLVDVTYDELDQIEAAVLKAVRKNQE